MLAKEEERIRRLRDDAESAIRSAFREEGRARAKAACYIAAKNRHRREEWPYGGEVLGKMLRALGWREAVGRNPPRIGGWRNHYSTGADGDPDMEAVVPSGLVRRRDVPEGRLYHVSLEGFRALRAYGYEVAHDNESARAVCAESHADPHAATP